MKEVEYANYWLRNPVTGKRCRSRWKMAREDALKIDPEATVVDGTTEIRQLPTTQRERDDRLYRR
ncbi:MAG TPA: hypothetical protein VFU71_03370 [Burkholderiaceae bacterium]|nr:hypothetical protein [Burkholderiaceae bacterium]